MVVVYATDHEPHSRALAQAGAAPGPGSPSPLHRGDRRHAEFLAGADLVIHDAQYTAIVGLTYGAAIWVVLNSLMLPVLFGRPTAWRIGWPAIWPSLTVHLVYGVATAAAALVVGRRGHRTHLVSGGNG